MVKPMSCSLQKYVLQAWFPESRRLDKFREGADESGQNLRTARDAQVQFCVAQSAVEPEVPVDLTPEFLEIRRLKDDDVPAELALQFARRAHCKSLSPVHDQHPVTTIRFIGQMRGENCAHRGRTENSPEEIPELEACSRIESGGRFVEQKQPGLVENSLCELDPSLKTSGKLLDALMPAIPEPEHLKGLFDSISKKGLCKPVEKTVKMEIFQHREFIIEGGGLKDNPQMSSCFARVLRNVPSVQKH